MAALKTRVPRAFLLAVLGLFSLAAALTSAQAEGLSSSRTYFHYKAGGKVSSVRIVRRYYEVVHSDAVIDPRLDPKLRRAATIAQERANARTKARCWRYVRSTGRGRSS